MGWGGGGRKAPRPVLRTAVQYSCAWNCSSAVIWDPSRFQQSTLPYNLVQGTCSRAVRMRIRCPFPPPARAPFQGIVQAQPSADYPKRLSLGTGSVTAAPDGSGDVIAFFNNQGAHMQPTGLECAGDGGLTRPLPRVHVDNTEKSGIPLTQKSVVRVHISKSVVRASDFTGFCYLLSFVGWAAWGSATSLSFRSGAWNVHARFGSALRQGRVRTLQRNFFVLARWC